MHSHEHSSNAKPFSCSNEFRKDTEGKRRLWIVLIFSSIYLIAEVVGGWISGSLALLADAGHMAIDIASLGLSIFAVWISQKPANDEKTFGYHRAEILAALMNGATLVVVSIWIFYEAWGRLSQPPEVRGGLMLVVASGGLVVNLIGLFVLRNQKENNINLRSVWLHLVTDTLGSASAILGGVLIYLGGWNLVDPIISIPIGGLILFGAWKLVSECVNVLLEGVPYGVDISEIRKGIEALSDVKSLHDLHVWTLTSGMTSLSAHITAHENQSTSAILEQVTHYLRDHHGINHVTIQVEPPDFKHQEDKPGFAQIK